MGMESPHSIEIKAAVMAALLEGQSVRSIANRYHIPKSTVGDWRKELLGNGPDTSDTKRERIGELIIDNLEAALEATIRIANLVTDKDWLTRQNASEVAVLYGVISDKTYRILEALPESGVAEAFDVSEVHSEG